MPPESAELELVVAFASEMIVEEMPTDPPTRTPQEGQVRLQIGQDRRVLWRWEDSEWIGYALSPIFGSGSPQGNVVADCRHQEYVDRDSISTYFDPGEGSCRWVSDYGGSTNWTQVGYYAGS